MANRNREEKNREPGRPSRPEKGESRAAARAREAAEAREKAAWIAERKRQEKEAAEAEAREKAAWIAERKRQEKEAAEEEARKKAAWIAERKRLKEEQLREEQRAEEEARQRAKNAKAAERQRKAEKRAKKFRKTMHGVKIALLVIMVLAVLLGAGWLLISHKINKGGTNLPNVFLGGIPVGGLTPEETQQKLEEEGWDQEENRILRVELPMGVSFELDRREAGLVMSTEEAVNAAYNYGHGSDQMSNVGNYLGSSISGVDLADGEKQLNREYVRQKTAAAVAEFRQKTSGESCFLDAEARVLHFVKGAGQMDIDQEKLYAAVEEALLRGDTLLVYDQVEGTLSAPNFRELYKQVYVEPVDARFSEKGFEVIPGTPGLDFDIPTARRMWLEAQPMQEILIPLREVEPKVTEETLKSELFKDCLGRQTSSYGGSSRARVNNINLAVSMIDGVILMPGETFSYNETVGQRTLDRGFQEAPAYASGKVVPEVGGGICQVSSTLYCATLYARMTTVSRTSHYFRVTYLPPGQDATVSWKDPDFQFRNDRDYPVKIVAYCDNESMELTIEIWGTDTDGIWVSLSCEQYAVHDTEYPEVIVGANVYLWISYYDADGNLLETVEGSPSTYHRHDYEIEWPPEKFKDDEGGDGDGEVIIDDGGGGGGDIGGGDDGGGDNGGGDNGGEGGGGGDDGGGGGGDVVIEP